MSQKIAVPMIVIESILILGLGFWLWNAFGVRSESTLPVDDEEPAVHLHADLRVVLNGQAFDFNRPELFERSERVHFHEGSVPVVHVEAEGVTWGEFFTTHGMELTKTCFNSDVKETFCTGEGKELRTYVNGARVDGLADLPVTDLERVLVFFGAPDENAVRTELANVTADACVQSGNCFGRDEEEQKAIELESVCTSEEPCKE